MQRIPASSRIAPAAGPYSPAVMESNVVYTSGQIGLTRTGTVIAGGVEAETRQVMKNLQQILQAAGSDFDHAIKATIYLTDAADFATVNKVYGSYFADSKYPARETVVVAALPLGAQIEISIIAKVKEGVA